MQQFIRERNKSNELIGIQRGEKTATFTITEALLSPISFSMLSGAGVVNQEKNAKKVHLTLEGTVKVTSGGSDVTSATITVDADDFAGYDIYTDDSVEAKNKNIGTSEEYQIYAMILDNNGSGVVEYISKNEITSVTATDDLVITLAHANVKDIAKYDGHTCLVDCYATTAMPVTTLTVDAENFGGTFYIEAETLFRDEGTGKDFPATFIIPKGKIQGNFTFNMAATGDPSTFDFTIDCTLGKVRGESGKVLYAIDIIDTISSASGHTDAETTEDGRKDADPQDKNKVTGWN